VATDLNTGQSAQLFTEVDPGDFGEVKVRAQMVHFYDRFFGEVLAPDHEEIDAAYQLFDTVYERTLDISYSWKVVLTALLQDFRLTHY
jgi:hypothetical protein